VARTIWLASYPKSGNTWFRIMVANLSAEDGKPVDINNRPYRGPPASERAPFERLALIDPGLLTDDEIDSLRPRVYEALAAGASEVDGASPAGSTVRFNLVHDAYRMTANGEPLLAGRRGADGAILIVRDPRDMVASLANHTRTSLDAAISQLNNRHGGSHVQSRRMHRLLYQRHGDWSGHARSWLEQDDLPVCLVRYEDMKADTVGVFTRALRFAGEPADDETIRRAVAFADFAELRRQEQANGFGERPVTPGGPFFRRGEVGGWRDELSAEQVTRIEAAHAPMMRRLGYSLAADAATAEQGPAAARGAA
jgi:hypothetical protein